VSGSVHHNFILTGNSINLSGEVLEKVVLKQKQKNNNKTKQKFKGKEEENNRNVRPNLHVVYVRGASLFVSSSSLLLLLVWFGCLHCVFFCFCFVFVVVVFATDVSSVFVVVFKAWIMFIWLEF